MSGLIRLFTRIIVLISISLCVSGALFSSSQIVSADTFSMSGIIYGPTRWHQAANAGSIWFYMLSEPTLSPYVDVMSRLHGSFWSGNVGWITFDHADPLVDQPYVTCPIEVFSGGLLCNVNGFAWSKNAGWIHLGGISTISTIASLRFNPDTVKFEGFGFSQKLGWIPFTGIELLQVAPGFQGKAFVIGNIAGNKAYNTTYNIISDSFDTVSFSTLLTSIRRRIVELSRGYDQSNRGLDYEIIQNEDYTVPISGWDYGMQGNIRSRIVIGADIIINGTILEDLNQPLSLIAMKSPSGSGGNIYITGDLGGQAIPDQIHASLIAEGAIISGMKNVFGANYFIDIGPLSIPTNQLYINGTVISRNTIGGAARSPAICPVLTNICTPEIAKRYDFNYFRNFVPASEFTSSGMTYNLTHRAYTKIPRLDTHGLIIEYDPRILSDPPPGLDLYNIN